MSTYNNKAHINASYISVLTFKCDALYVYYSHSFTNTKYRKLVTVYFDSKLHLTKY